MLVTHLQQLLQPEFDSSKEGLLWVHVHPLLLCASLHRLWKLLILVL